MFFDKFQIEKRKFILNLHGKYFSFSQKPVLSWYSLYFYVFELPI
jgi:hypothetical protein